MSSKMHNEQKSEQHQQQSADETHIRYFFDLYRRMMDQKPKEQYRQSTRYDDDDRSMFQKCLETLHRSTTYRPGPSFLPITFAVVLISGCICSVVGVTYLYTNAR